MPQAETRRLAAIMFTGMVGFSRQMGGNEACMLRLLDVHNHITQQAVAEHHGTVIKTVGDAFLVDFPSVVHAVQCAQQIQHSSVFTMPKKNRPNRFTCASVFTRAMSCIGERCNVRNKKALPFYFPVPLSTVHRDRSTAPLAANPRYNSQKRVSTFFSRAELFRAR
jgi:hypothetical protein